MNHLAAQLFRLNVVCRAIGPNVALTGVRSVTPGLPPIGSVGPTWTASISDTLVHLYAMPVREGKVSSHAVFSKIMITTAFIC